MVDQNTTNLFNQIYDSTNKKVFSYITAKCSSTSDISDIFQETYLEVYAALKKHGSDYVNNREAFVMKIAKQKIYRYYSLLDRMKSIVPLFSPDENEEEVSIADLETNDFTFENEESEKMTILQINQFLSQKPAGIQKIFVLFYYMDLSIPEISKLLSMSESNVKNKLYRTLKDLRKLYDKDGATND